MPKTTFNRSNLRNAIAMVCKPAKDSLHILTRDGRQVDYLRHHLVCRQRKNKPKSLEPVPRHDGAHMRTKHLIPQTPANEPPPAALQ